MKANEAINFKQTFKAYYSPKAGKPEIITPPKMQFLMIDGQGNPNDSVVFQNAIQVLYAVAYGLKFSRKKAGLTPDFSVGTLEGLWWVKEGKEFAIGAKHDWVWTLMIWMPDFITKQDITQQLAVVKAKKPDLAFDTLRLESFNEGTCVQIMHVGPYSEEEASVTLMDNYAQEHGYRQSGKHHEIYMGDPRRAAPDKLKTIIRHPITKVGKED